MCKEVLLATITLAVSSEKEFLSRSVSLRMRRILVGRTSSARRCTILLHHTLSCVRDFGRGHGRDRPTCFET